MSLRKNPKDHDLDFLLKCSDDDLLKLVDILIGKKEGDVRKKRSCFAELQRQKAYMMYPEEPTRYVNEIIAEIEAFGGNTIANFLRGYGVTYREVLCDVAEKFKINFNSKQPIDLIERRVLERVFVDDAKFLLLTEEAKEAFFDDFVKGHIEGNNCAYIPAATYNILRGGMLAGGAVALAIPIFGLVLESVFGVGCLLKMFSDNYTITVPAVIYIALLRRAKKLGV